MSMVDKFLSAMKISGEGDEGFYDDDDSFYNDTDPIEPKAAPVKSDLPSEPAEEKKKSILRSPASHVRRMPGSGMEVCVIKPTSVEDAREITDTLLANRTVVLNLEGLDMDIAQRIIDFTSGSTYAMQGNLQKISRYMFLITPASVDVSGDFQAMLGGTFEDSLGQDGPTQIG